METVRGFPHTPVLPAIPLRRTRKFIPTSTVADIIINEGLRLWTIRQYLGIIHRVRPESADSESIEIAVAFEEIHPPFPILIQVYHGLRELLFDEYSDESTQEE
ncbi:hypothetical protein FRB99_005503 [Tulasnella sp. 403]|nr:hypothetical protein FRB99_005503 [Tulasnella sp. 403]